MNKLIVFCIVIAAAACGCSTAKVRLGRPIKPADIKTIEPGKTTKAEILQKFGAPASITITSVGVQSYTFVEAATDNHTWTIPPLLIIYIDGVASSLCRALVVNFKGDVVVNYAYSVNSTMGAAEAGSTEGFQGATLPD